MAEVLTLTKKEDEWVHEILKDKGEIVVSVPDTLTPTDILIRIRGCVKYLGKADRYISKMKPVLGRLMILARKNKEVYTSAGYRTYSQFLKKELEDKFGISHSSLYEIGKVMRAFPALSLEQYGLIPTASLLLLAKFTDSTKADHRKLLDKAANMTYDRLREWCVEKGYLEQSDVDSGATFSVTGSRTAIGRIKKFFKDPRVVAWCESSNPGDILAKMIEEVSTEWYGQGEKAIAAKGGNSE